MKSVENVPLLKVISVSSSDVYNVGAFRSVAVLPSFIGLIRLVFVKTGGDKSIAKQN